MDRACNANILRILGNLNGWIRDWAIAGITGALEVPG